MKLTIARLTAKEWRILLHTEDDRMVDNIYFHSRGGLLNYLTANYEVMSTFHNLKDVMESPDKQVERIAVRLTPAGQDYYREKLAYLALFG